MVLVPHHITFRAPRALLRPCSVHWSPRTRTASRRTSPCFAMTTAAKCESLKAAAPTQCSIWHGAHACVCSCRRRGCCSMPEPPRLACVRACVVGSGLSAACPFRLRSSRTHSLALPTTIIKAMPSRVLPAGPETLTYPSEHQIPAFDQSGHYNAGPGREGCQGH